MGNEVIINLVTYQAVIVQVLVYIKFLNNLYYLMDISVLDWMD